MYVKCLEMDTMTFTHELLKHKFKKLFLKKYHQEIVKSQVIYSHC